MMEKLKKILVISWLSIATTMIPLSLSGCDLVVLNPSGLVAQAESYLILISFLVMLCIVAPVMIVLIFFSIRYRASNPEVEYKPDWGESRKIEVFMWGIPILVVAILASLSAYFIHKYEPSNTLDIASAETEKPLHIDVVALDWKWLFIYPEYGIATINEIYAPTGRQVSLQITAQDTLNAFWVPTLGTVLYAMPQMNAKLHLFSHKNGVFNGISANYSGAGFSDMRFFWYSVTQDVFNIWVNNVRKSKKRLDRSIYIDVLAQKSKNNPVEYFSSVEQDLYYRIVNRCIPTGSLCNEDLMRRSVAKSLWGQLCSVFDEN